MDSFSRPSLLRDEVMKILMNEILHRRPTGSAMPSENELVRQLKVSRNTVRAAYAALETEGMIERVRGRGTFVVSKTARSQKTGEIGLVFFASPDTMFLVPFYSRLIGEICRQAVAAKFHVYLLTHDVELREFRYDWQEHAARLEREVAAMAIGVFKPGALESLAQRKPIVAVDAGGPFDFCDSVAADDFQAGRVATQHLLDLGHRRIAFMGAWATSPTDVIDASDTHRYEGYCAALCEAGIVPEEDLRLESRGAFRAISAALQSDDRPTAFIGNADAVAEGMNIAHQQGLRIPQDVSFIGVGEAIVAGPGGMTLSTVELRPEQMGQMAMKMLQRRLAEPSALPEHQVVSVTFVERGTTATATW